MKIIVPSYFYPSHPDWKKLEATKGKNVAGVILNHSSGKGTISDLLYIDLANRIREWGGTDVISYVHTQRGNRDLKEVWSDVERQQLWYKPTSIFFDEAATSVEKLPYFRALYHLCQREKLKVILNPGTTPDEGYVQISDIICNVETDKPESAPDWVFKYSPKRWWHIVHSVPKARMKEVVKNCKFNNAGNIFVTDDSGENPYDKLPSYWPELLQWIRFV